MTRDEIYAAWAPKGSRWTPWVKPVLFAYVNEASMQQPSSRGFAWLDDIVTLESESAAGHPHRSSARTRDVLVIVDLPGDASIHAGVALLTEGFFPVPLFNALPHPAAVIDLSATLDALGASISTRQQAALSSNTLPAFMLDSRRHGYGVSLTPGRFDNRSVVFAADFPSAESLMSSGGRRVLVVHQIDLALDLTNILLDWQRAGLEIYSKRVDRTDPPSRQILRAPSMLVRAMQWLTRNALPRVANGTFGALIERPHASG